MEHKRNYFLTLFVIIAILFSYLNCDTEQSGDGKKYFASKGNVTCEDKGKKGVTVSIYKKNSQNTDLEVLNSTQTDDSGNFDIQGEWQNSGQISTKICFDGSCTEGRKKRDTNDQKKHLCFHFPYGNITDTKEKAEKNPYVVSVPLDYSS